QAIVHDPELLILDEPLTGMDPLMRRRTIRLIKDWARAGKSVVVSSHVLHEIEAMTSNILLINNGRIVAEGNVHQIRDLIDTHPHTVFIRAGEPRRLARSILAEDGIISLRFEPGAVVVETARPDAFYARLTDLAATGEAGGIDDKTLTYLFTSPVLRGAVLVGKYLAYMVCTVLVVLPSIMVVYFLIVPLAEIAGSFKLLVIDLGIMALGLAAYGALFALVGT